MSADRDRAIRRQKQKRAKDNKRLARQQRNQAAGTAPRAPAPATAKQKAA